MQLFEQAFELSKN